MTKKRLTRLAALFLVVCLCVSMFACRKQSEDPAGESTGASGSAGSTYTVEVATESGVLLEGVGVYIYTDETLNELVWFDRTDADGKMTFTDSTSDSYVAVLKDTPVGYLVEELYKITGETTQIQLAMEMISDDALEGISIKLGDAMFDFSVTTPDGTEYTLSELLADKEAVVLNFWYLECVPCRQEFPYLQEAYEKYSDQIEILALNPVNDDEEEIADFQKELGLTFPMAKCDPAWETAMNLIAYPTTVVIDRYGVVSLIHTGSVTKAETFEDVFAYFTADDYEKGVVENLEDLKSEDSEEDIEFENPTDIGGVSSFQVMVEPDEVVYVNVYKVSKLYLTIKDADAYVIYNNKTYKPSNGTVSLMISADDVSSAVNLGFGNTGSEAKIFTINLSMPKGTLGNPYAFSLGEFSVSVAAGNAQGVYYTYSVPETGTITVKCLSATAGVPYDFILYNLSSYAWRNLQGDVKFDENGYTYVNIKVRAGDKLQFSVGTLPDDSGSYPAATFTFLASFSAGEEEETQVAKKITYAVTVTDENRKALAGVGVYLDINGSTVNLTTDANGVAYTEQVAGTYTATLRVPSGYKARTTKYTLTEKIPTISVKLDQDIVEQAEYKVTAVDESGAPIQGALVTIGSNFGLTDASGVYSVTLNKGDYTVVVSADGYEIATGSMPESGILVVMLQKENDSDTPSETTPPETTPPETTPDAPSETTPETEPDPAPSTASYSVKIVDYGGKAVSGVAVTFSGDNGTAVKLTDSSGAASATLTQGSYNVTLSFSSGSYYYVNDVVLTAENTSATIKVANKETDGVRGDVGNLYDNDTYYVYEGATYVTLQADLYNYFLFAPTESGTYQFTTSDPNAEISYWGSSTAFISNITSTTDYANNVFTLNIKPTHLGGTQILGITGADECVLIITRIGDAKLDDTDIVAETWEGKTTPTQSFVLRESGKQTFVDLTKNPDVVLGTDGRYHLNNANGPVLYVALGNVQNQYRWLPLSDAFAVTNEDAVLNFIYINRDENGNALSKERYNECMKQYIECRDETYGVYPLTEDLIYMLRNGGEYVGWYNLEDPDCVVPDEELTAGYDPEILWMFNVCYFE